MMKCPECQHDVSEAARTCPQCGHPFVDQPASTADGSTSAARKWILIVFNVIVGLWFVSEIVDYIDGNNVYETDVLESLAVLIIGNLVLGGYKYFRQFLK